MKQYSLLQIFTSASLGLGHHSADEIAKHIKTHTKTPYFPLANTGDYPDILAHEKAAKANQLKPIYGRTLSVFEKKDGVILFAKSNKGRNWLYAQPAQYTLPDDLVLALKNMTVDDIAAVIPSTWTDSSMFLFANAIRQKVDTFLGWDLQSKSYLSAEGIRGWRLIPHLPLQCLSSKDVHNAQLSNTIIRKRHAVQTCVFPTHYPSCYRSPEEVQDTFSEVLSSHVDSMYDMNALFSMCNTTPLLILDAEEQPDTELDNQQSLSQLKRQCEHQLDQFLQKETSASLEPRRYRARLKEELSLIHEKGVASRFEGILSLPYAKKADPSIPFLLKARGPLNNCLIFFLFDMSLVDPVKYGLPAYRYFSMFHSNTPGLPRFDFDSSPHTRTSIDEHLGREEGHYFSAQHPNCLTALQALREIAKQPYINASHASNIKKVLRTLEPPYIYSRDINQLRRDNAHFDRFLNKHSALLPSLKMLTGKVFHYGPHASLRVLTPDSKEFLAPCKKGDTSNALPNRLGLSNKDLELCPFVQFNLLGLNTLESFHDVIAHPRSYITAVEDIPLGEQDVFESLTKNRLGVFQFEHRVFDIPFKESPPQSIEDMANLLALIRPGWMDSQTYFGYLNAKSNTRPDYLNNDGLLDDILSTSRGYLLYQEQSFQILTEIGKLEPDEAMNWARGKKKVDNDGNQALWKLIVEATHDNELADALVAFLSPVLDKTFLRGHALGYATMAYYSAWMRKRYPTLYLPRRINNDLRHCDSINERCDLLEKMIELGLTITGINRSNLNHLSLEVVDDVWQPKNSDSKLTLSKLSHWRQK